jgi:hypothetical protein
MSFVEWNSADDSWFFDHADSPSYAESYGGQAVGAPQPTQDDAEAYERASLDTQAKKSSTGLFFSPARCLNDRRSPR